MEENKLENLKNNSSSEDTKHGGARTGAGRPAGSENGNTKIRREALERFKERVANVADELFHAQFNLAKGAAYLICVETVAEGKNTKKVSTVVEDAQTIIDYFDGKLDGNGKEYYYISTKPADNKAIDSLLDRTFGKATEKIDLNNKGEPLSKVVIEFVDKNGVKNASDERTTSNA